MLATHSCRYQRGRFYRGWGFCIGFFLLATFIIVLSISLSIRYNDYDSTGDNGYAPGDTRIISYSRSFCEGLTLSGTDTATLYLLDSTPPLSDPSYPVSETFNPTVGYSSNIYIYFYLHKGSQAEVTYCLDYGGLLEFAIIKGKDNFNEWKYEGGSSHTEQYFTVSNDCSSGSRSFSYTVVSGDTYYFAFGNTGYDSVRLTASLNLKRTEYLPNQVEVHDSCTSGSILDCTVSVPYGSDYVALLEVDGNDYLPPVDGLYFSWSCKPRVWIYVLIVLVPLLFVFIVTTISLTVCIIYVRKKSQRYATLPTATAETPAEPGTATVTTTTVITATAPPPVNPGYNPPPKYGAVDTTNEPPPYAADGSK